MFAITTFYSAINGSLLNTNCSFVFKSSSHAVAPDHANFIDLEHSLGRRYALVSFLHDIVRNLVVAKQWSVMRGQAM